MITCYTRHVFTLTTFNFIYGGQFTLSTQLINPDLCDRICTARKEVLVSVRFFNRVSFYTLYLVAYSLFNRF